MDTAWNSTVAVREPGPTLLLLYRYPYGFTGYYAQPIVVISPAYYPYYLPSTLVASAPFYCLAHQAGWVSRAGMIDHLSGTHKIPLATAASVCPEATESCVVDGYR